MTMPWPHVEPAERPSGPRLRSRSAVAMPLAAGTSVLLHAAAVAALLLSAPAALPPTLWIEGMIDIEFVPADEADRPARPGPDLPPIGTASVAALTLAERSAVPPQSATAPAPPPPMASAGAPDPVRLAAAPPAVPAAPDLATPGAMEPAAPSPTATPSAPARRAVRR